MRTHPGASAGTDLQDGSPITLPRGVALAPGEVALVGETFMLGTIVFYLHSQLVLTNRRLYAARPNTILGLIPAGTSRRNFPIGNIAGVSATTRFNVLSLILGGLAAIAGLSALSSSANGGGGIVLLVIGALLILAAPGQALEFMNSGGGTVRFPVSAFERGKTVEFANRVSEALARQPSGRDSDAPDRATGSDPTESIRHLSRLRDDGLISEAEFAAKRADILSRL